MKNTWEKITQQEIEELINNTIEKIFKNENTQALSKFEKRKKIYNYLVETKEYDYEYFEGIFRNYHEPNKAKRFQRNPQQEFLNPLITDKGICNGFSQVYKLLLEKVKIYSICINCAIEYKNEYVGHQLNLVYDQETQTYSFDDITFGIQNDKKEEYFNYDNPEEKGQGIGCLSQEIRWAILDEDIINYFSKRQNPLIKPLYEYKEKNNLFIKTIEELRNNGTIIKKHDENCDIIKKRR